MMSTRRLSNAITVPPFDNQPARQPRPAPDSLRPMRSRRQVKRARKPLEQRPTAAEHLDLAGLDGTSSPELA